MHRCGRVGGVEPGSVLGELDEAVHAGLEDLVVGGDALGQVGQLLLERRLDGGVLVLGVVDQEGDDVRAGGRRGRRGRCPGSGRGWPASMVTENSSVRMALWMSR